MRFKVVLSILVGAASLLIVLTALRSGPRNDRNPELVAAMEEKPAVTNVLAAEELPAVRVVPAPVIARPAEGRESDATADTIAARVTRLQELAMADDADSLNNILSDLENRDPEIREAALQATIQFGSRDAIPKLLELAGRTDDPQAKRALEDAADFLSLPSLTEVIEQNKTAVK